MPPSTPKPRDHAPIHLWHPIIDSTLITTIPHLHQILETEYPGLHRNPHYSQLLRDAELHLTFIQFLKGKTHLSRGDRKRIGNELGVSRQKFTAWAQHARKPRLYYELERTLSKTQAQTKITQLHNENSDLRSTEDVLDRLQTYYLTPLHEQSKGHQKRIDQCTIYFHSVDLLKDGGNYTHIARELGIHHSQIQRWLDGQRPDYVELARKIPRIAPTQENRWLPLSLERAFVPKNFIQVPTKITHHTQILTLLDQLHALTNKNMQKWQIQFGPQNKVDAYYYILGIIVSDCEKQKPRISSTELKLNLSKRYPWSKQLGEAICYYLGQLGIFARKGKDTSSSKGQETCLSWRSQKTPLITWISRTALGLQEHERTTYHKIKADWLLDSPKETQIAFLQGLNDGDGWASINDQCIGNACHPNIPFVKTLLSTLGIDSADDKKRVRIRSQKGIIKVTELPAFRHAIGRQQNAEKIAEMMRVRQKQKPGSYTIEIKTRIIELNRSGFSSGKIAKLIFDEYHVSLDSSMVRRLIRARK